TISGSGVVNNNGAAGGTTGAGSVGFWSTGSASQQVTISGGSKFVGTIYAPHGSVTQSSGTTAFYGAIVGYDILYSGGGAFHFDETLTNGGAANPFSASRWRELITAADQSTYSSLLNF